MNKQSLFLKVALSAVGSLAAQVIGWSIFDGAVYGSSQFCHVDALCSGFSDIVMSRYAELVLSNFLGYWIPTLATLGVVFFSYDAIKKYVVRTKGRGNVVVQAGVTVLAGSLFHAGFMALLYYIVLPNL